MSTIDYVHAFSQFAAQLPVAEREQLSIDELYERWRAEAFREDDVEAIRESLAEYEAGERGLPAREFLARVRAERRGGPSP